MKYSFEEVKIIYESAEKVTDRRINLSKNNYGVNLAIFVAIGFIYKWTAENPSYFFCGVLLVILLCFLGSVFCTLWIRQITDYKNLNRAKFLVIKDMCRKLTFLDPATKKGFLSYVPFKKEWEYLESWKAVGETKFKLEALKSSKFEYFLPEAFRIIFIVFLILCTFSICLNPSETFDGIKTLLHLKKV